MRRKTMAGWRLTAACFRCLIVFQGLLVAKKVAIVGNVVVPWHNRRATRRARDPRSRSRCAADGGRRPQSTDGRRALPAVPFGRRRLAGTETAAGGGSSDTHRRAHRRSTAPPPHLSHPSLPACRRHHRHRRYARSRQTALAAARDCAGLVAAPQRCSGATAGALQRMCLSGGARVPCGARYRRSASWQPLLAAAASRPHVQRRQTWLAAVRPTCRQQVSGSQAAGRQRKASRGRPPGCSRGRGRLWRQSCRAGTARLPGATASNGRGWPRLIRPAGLGLLCDMPVVYLPGVCTCVHRTFCLI
ncbi:uncharacterized protein V1510DRAFT_317665 [Dipodascopsis tothii]|uniref:uncharacterized protein n=1 Tax=Dipodascopsis tothii TaxID=44089 RepID=UPI0034CDB53E